MDFELRFTFCPLNYIIQCGVYVHRSYSISNTVSYYVAATLKLKYAVSKSVQKRKARMTIF